MPRVYSVEFENVAVTAAQDFFEVAPASNKPVRLLGLFLSQSTDVGDSEEEMLRLKIIRGATTSGSGGSAATPRPMDAIDAAAGASAEVNNTTVATGGTPIDLFAHTFNIRVGLELWFPPECCPRCSAAENRIVVNLVAAPGDSVTMGGTLFFEEIS